MMIGAHTICMRNVASLMESALIADAEAIVFIVNT